MVNLTISSMCVLYPCVYTDDERHDVYLTIQQGFFGRGNKRADKNVQVDMEVLNDRNEVIQVIMD